jgi:hypothetical protein
MTDNQLIAVLFQVITAGLAAQAITVGTGAGQVALKQSYQPRQQGAPLQPCVYLHKLSDKDYGFPMRSDVFVSAGNTTHTETQNVLTSYQVNATAIQNPADTNALTASDYVNAVQLALSFEGGITALKTAGIGIFRITAITNTQWRDEQERFESDPSFDFIVSHKRQIVVTIPSTAAIIPVFNPI